MTSLRICFQRTGPEIMSFGVRKRVFKCFLFLSQEKVSKISDSETGRSLSISSYSNITHTHNHIHTQRDRHRQRRRKRGFRFVFSCNSLTGEVQFFTILSASDSEITKTQICLTSSAMVVPITFSHKTTI